jgi:hypothetical protein
VTRLPSRRRILQGGAALGALAAAGGCRKNPPAERPARELRQDLERLVRVIGPWAAAAAAEADHVIPRYLSDERVKRFEADRAAYTQLAARFADHGPAAESIDLAVLTPAERTALVALTADLYSVMQVRFAVSGNPVPGQCVADPQWQTQVPPA